MKSELAQKFIYLLLIKWADKHISLVRTLLYPIPWLSHKEFKELPEWQLLSIDGVREIMAGKDLSKRATLACQVTSTQAGLPLYARLEG